MNRQEFMRRLEQLLEGIPEEEKREAIAYYTSYFEDAGEENEEKIIRELESPEKVAATIRADFPGCNNSETASSGNQQNYNGASQSMGQQNYNGASQNMGQQNYNGTIQREDNTTRNILLIILLVLTSPIWGGILVAIGGTLAGIIGGLSGIAVGCVIGGIAVVGVAITILVTGVISLGFISMAAGMESPEWTPVRSMCCMTPGISTSVPSEMTSTSSSLPIRYWSTSTGFSILPERMISM